MTPERIRELQYECDRFEGGWDKISLTIADLRHLLAEAVAAERMMAAFKSVWELPIEHGARCVFFSTAQKRDNFLRVVSQIIEHICTPPADAEKANG
jgi:hypothetical protein